MRKDRSVVYGTQKNRIILIELVLVALIFVFAASYQLMSHLATRPWDDQETMAEGMGYAQHLLKEYYPNSNTYSVRSVK
ncbi:hypothetical protein [Sporosarcina sp. A2]|uniref:hypothetical protein n=1 Tax=Sporosarcina sp. A2 TaxID=3393449 RepID=UPI003D7AABDC